MRLTDLTLMSLYLNSLIDSGRHDDITLGEVKKHIDKGTILAFLKSQFADERDFGSFLDRAISGDFASEYVVHLQSIYDAYAGDERKRWGVEKKGLCLLLAWTNEIIQMGDIFRPGIEGWKPYADIARRNP